ncbi:MAG: hypothetical protein ACYCU5_10890 [Actinomycetes bacterium]
MLLYADPEGADLSKEQLRRLDDAFFESNPVVYLRSRLDALMAPARQGDAATRSCIGTTSPRCSCAGSWPTQ